MVAFPIATSALSRCACLLLLTALLSACTYEAGTAGSSNNGSDGNTPTPASPPTTPAPSPDTQAPSIPSQLQGQALSTTQIALDWQAASDNVGVDRYEIARNGTVVGNTSTTRFTDTGLSAGTTYRYTVRARDAAGNYSGYSPETLATTTAIATRSSLADAAAAMRAGEWRELITANLEPTLYQASCGATRSIFPYTEDAVWDPVSRRVLFIGSDHLYLGDCPTLIGQRFISYSEATNSWAVQPNPPWFGPGGYHGYDHSAMDAANGIYYHFPYAGYGNRPLHRYDTSTDTWLADTPASPDTTCCAGVEYFPQFVGTNTSVAAGGVVMAGGGNVHVYRPATNSWTSALSATRLNFGDYHTLAEYNPVHEVVIFGGGENYSPYQAFRTLYKLAPNGSITALRDAPFTLRVNLSIVTVDPVSGDYLVFGPNGEFYAFDVTANTWTQQTGTAPFASPKRDSSVTAVDLTVATPISTYGVVMFVKHIPGNADQTKVYLYKHR